jgi:hypothetical protein
MRLGSPHTEWNHSPSTCRKVCRPGGLCDGATSLWHHPPGLRLNDSPPRVCGAAERRWCCAPSSVHIARLHRREIHRNIKPHICGPILERTRRGCFHRWGVMPFAKGTRAVAVVLEDAGSERGGFGNHAGIAIPVSMPTRRQLEINAAANNPIAALFSASLRARNQTTLNARKVIPA